MANLKVTNVIVFLSSLYVLVMFIVPLLGNEFLSKCFGWISSVIISYTIASRFTNGTISTVQGKAVLVTGCDTGIGNTLARHLDQLGFRVFAGCLFADGDNALRLRNESSKRLEVIQLDVTSDQQVSDAVSFIKSTLSTSGDVLWGVVNNAGMACWGFVEWISLARYKKLTEVNLWGMIRVTKASLPLIQSCKGRVVNISSMLGRFSPPMCSPYCITKYGVQAFTDSLRCEMFKFGVSAVIIEPGNFSAGSSAMFTREFMSNDMDKVWSETPEYIKESYGEEIFNSTKNSIVSTSQGTATTSLVPVIDACTCALTDINPQERYFPGNVLSKLSVWFFVLVPATLSDYVYKFYMFFLPNIKGIKM